MKTSKRILMLLTFASFVLSIAACSKKGEENDLMSQFVGTWSGEIGDLYGIGECYKVIFTTMCDGTYTADDWVDREGYGIFLHAGSCTDKWEVYALDGFSKAGNIYIDFHISPSLDDYPSVLNNVSLVKDVNADSFVTYNDLTSDLLTFKRYSDPAPDENSIIGYWQFESLSGTYTDGDGISHEARPGQWTVKCMYFSDSEINGHKGCNGIVFNNMDRKFPGFMKYSCNGAEISVTELALDFVINSLTENKLTVSYRGQEDDSYLDLDIVYKRVPTYDNK